MAEREPLQDPPEPRRRQEGDEKVVLRRREADWTDAERDSGLDADFAVRRAAVDVAAAALAAHDGLTAGHSDDVVTLCDALATRLALNDLQRARLLAAAQLHDLGKVAVPQQVLDKPGPLDRREWDLMQDHTLCGQRILATVPELAEVGRIVRHSHERWDGAGYPDGLAGEEIPLESRIVFCADAFHAIRCDRPYRRGSTAAAALAELHRYSGTQFDPMVVEAIEEEAASLRTSAVDRLTMMTSAVRSRRLVALLLSLVVSGTALAAPGSPLRGGSGVREAVAATGAHCSHPCVGGSVGALAAVRRAVGRKGRGNTGQRSESEVAPDSPSTSSARPRATVHAVEESTQAARPAPARSVAVEPTSTAPAQTAPAARPAKPAPPRPRRHAAAPKRKAHKQRQANQPESQPEPQRHSRQGPNNRPPRPERPTNPGNGQGSGHPGEPTSHGVNVRLRLPR